MYIGTDLTEKSDLNAIIDMLNFTFSISSYSIPYLEKYGTDYNNVYNTDVLINILTSTISRLGISGLSLKNINISQESRRITMNIDYDGTSISKSIDM